ncbi:MAG: PEP-CTERM sorting domain-containing protein [Methylomonas sp.]|jgi:hypothetical protein|uniref:PEP-CTERM sorting domain-containing protein n=1 Tax=Methylomonas sp. TaxID=418 RepID=UPI0025F64FA8|nr:PEP-CTERM sorting domain-containing protein [Methylomonas sp.]MCK9607063.1 PEP-CTERM sorting domain-containing protein [Methylomonas sp.]
MNKIHLFTGPLLIAALLATGSAQATLLSDLIGQSLTVGDKTFDQWTIHDDTFSPANLISSIDVTGIGDGSAGNEYGLSFTLTSPLTVTGIDFADLFFGFRVTASAGLINGVGLGVTGSLTASGTNNGYGAWEYVGTSEASAADQFALDHLVELNAEQVWANGAVNGSLVDSGFFGPRSEIFIGKNLYVFSDTDTEASLSSFEQRFYQTNNVPEPSTLLLMSLGIIGLFHKHLRGNSCKA